MKHKEFVDMARDKQARYMERWGKCIDCFTTEDEEYKVRNRDRRVWLTPPYARQGLVFYEGIRDEVLGLTDIKRRLRNQNDMMLAIVLRSEHIPYNLFYPLAKIKDNPAIPTLLNQMLGREAVKSVEEIRIEYAPKCRQRYLNDGTSFDTYITYRDAEDRLCGIGIEVKYTEREYVITAGTKEWRETHDERGKTRLGDFYADATQICGYYREGVEDLLVTDYLRQIWRNHLLGGLMESRKEIAKFDSILIFPDLNQHFHDAVGIYRAVMNEKGNASFHSVTYEQYVDMLRRLLHDEESIKWIDYLQERYLFSDSDLK